MPNSIKYLTQTHLKPIIAVPVCRIARKLSFEYKYTYVRSGPQLELRNLGVVTLLAHSSELKSLDIRYSTHFDLILERLYALACAVLKNTIFGI